MQRNHNYDVVRWEETGDNIASSRLLSVDRVSICGVPMHLEAVAVREGENGIQEAVEFHHTLDLLASLGDGALCCTRIEGAPYDYVIYAVPYQL